MSQQYEYPPPPPPTPRSNGLGNFSFQQRQRPAPAQPPSITTNLVRTLGAQSQTPSSVTSFAAGQPLPFSPSTPSALNPRTPSALAPPPASPSASPRSPNMEPYNPQQWSGRGQVSGTQMVFGRRGAGMPSSTREATGMEEAMPSPPPPYSPETPDSGVQISRASPMLDTTTYVTSPLAEQVPMSPAFPPPPGQSSRHRERSSSGQRAFFSLAGLRGKQPVNVLPQHSNTVHVIDDVEPKPPAARRAASTGHLQSYGAAGASVSPVQVAGRSSPGSSWQPGMPLPGPPPGPPPPGARSQSLNRYPASSSRSNSVGSEHSIETPQQRRATATSNLGPIPPTPADWVDPDTVQQEHDHPQFQVSAESAEPLNPPLRIDTGMNQDSSLSRRPAKRDSSTQGIRERRSRSRAAKDGNDIMSPASDTSRPSDLIFTTASGSISRRREHMRTASGYVEPVVEPVSKPVIPARSSHQPPVSNINTVLTPPYTPALNKTNNESSKKSALRAPGSASSDRPISHLLHQPLEDAAMPAPLTPVRPGSATSAKLSAKLDPFVVQATERHRSFVEKEAAATSDEERLELFANFMVHESRLRRDRYTTAYNAMAGDIVDLTRDMWRSYTRQGKRAVTPSTSMSSFDQTVPSWGSDGQPASASSFGEYTPATEGGSIGEGIERSESRQWGEAFKPSLSPIPSMNVSTVPDEDSSRGRTASRWWEQSNSGGGSVGRPDRMGMEKTKRETKYMGVNPSTLQDNDQPSDQSSWHTASTPGPSTQTFVADEYPPEKMGWHEPGDFETPQPTPGARPRKTSTLGASMLDVSRLLTLPPPYPRHHPAVNNSHPLLVDIRDEYRSLSVHEDIQEIRDAYAGQDAAIQRQQDEASNQRRKQLRATIQQKVADGSVSYAQAAQAEADFDVEEAERGKANARTNFDLFENKVAHPVNGLLTDKLGKATACIGQLRVELESRNEISDPNQAQEEGDEQPERLEKLTLLKWLFEAREQLHKEMFDLHADRSAKYSEVILTPYRIARQQAKIDEAAAFFAKDGRDRQVNFARDSLKRYEDLRSIIEQNVSRGVEDQLSAFWDIAPDLLGVVQHLPAHMAELEIRIPEQEYDENPAYNDYPLQYLYSLLGHAQKSTYQFIESQTNLLCLLHEVRTATTKSSLRVLEMERTKANPNDKQLKAEMQIAKEMQEERLTKDLQEKVGEVERQWREALGEGLEECTARVRDYLEESGGWEDGLDG